jgi:bifunctional non-homologous end joining protein LigD
MGEAARDGRSAQIFVIQEHHARALHWDFRLERDGVLVSWALPKGLPDDPKRNHLAVHTEDHPLEYQDFEGDIPKGEYGGGHVSIWDRGTYEVEKWLDDEVKVVLHGTRANGRYVLFPTGKPSDKNWMIHRMDPPAEGFEEMPARIEPMQAVAGSLPVRRTGWAFEFAWGGRRTIAYIEGGRVHALDANGTDLTGHLPELRHLGAFLGSRSAIFDGELVAIDREGRPNPEQLREQLDGPSRPGRRRNDDAPTYFIFDLLYLDGRSTIGLSYDERRELLESLELHGRAYVTAPAFTDMAGKAVLAVSREKGLEGVVAKKRRSPYTPGAASGSWIAVGKD